MATFPEHNPKYRHYKPKDVGAVRIDGRDHYWASLFRKWRGNGLTQPEFCRTRGLSIHTLRRRLDRHVAKPGAVEASQPVAVTRSVVLSAGERPEDH